MFYGYFHTDWKSMQDLHLKQQKLPRQHNQATNTIRRCVSEFHNCAKELWELRNQHLHGKDKDSTSCFKRVQLLEEVREIYATRNHYLYSDLPAIYGNTSLEERMTHPTGTLTEWLNKTRVLTKRSIQAAAKIAQVRRGTRPITSYFATVRPPEDNPIAQQSNIA